MMNLITQLTKRNILDELRENYFQWAGRLDEIEFLYRIYNLSEMPTTDIRYKDAEGDIIQHRRNNEDWDDYWVFNDSRFKLQGGTDEEYLTFICEMLHPVVVANENDALRMLNKINEHLGYDGYKLVPDKYISGRPVYVWEHTSNQNTSEYLHENQQNKVASKFKVRNKIESLLSLLAKYFKNKGLEIHARVLAQSKYWVNEGVHYDNWDGGIYGHDLHLVVPDDLLLKIIDDEETKMTISSKISSEFKVDGEFISHVYFENDDSEINSDWRVTEGLLPSRNLEGKLVESSEYDDLWEFPGLRLFLSHKANYRVETKALKDELAQLGIRAFVAHDDIEPSDEWQLVIERALSSMDALVALLTSDFNESNWTDQEVGIAFGRRVPIISLRLGKDPYGFIGKWQGISCNGKNDCQKADEIFSILLKKHGKRNELFSGLAYNFEVSSSFANAEINFKNLLKLSPFSDEESKVLKEAYKNNSQNSGCFYIKSNKYLLD